MSAVISCGALTYTHPDGSVALDGLDMLVPAGRSGLVGVNGSGKSTLLKLIAGELRPTSGMVHASGEIGYLPQDLTIRADQSVPDLLGLTPVLAAIEAIENGSTDQTDFDTVGDDWDLAERVRAELDRLGLPAAVLDRSLGELSGGEVIRLGLARLLLRRPDVLLLDEPTNNLDGESRRHLYDVVSAWQRTLLVVSHDRELLEHVERIGDLRDGGVTWYGGGYSDYAAAVAAEQEAAAQAISTAKAEVRRERRDLAEAERVIAQRRRYGAKMQANKREPKIVMGLRKRSRRSRRRRSSRPKPTGWTRPARIWARRRPACVRTVPSVSTCPAPRFPPDASCSPPNSWCCATGCPRIWICGDRSVSAWWGPTVRVRPPCCTPSPDASRPPRVLRRCMFRSGSCHSAWTCWTIR